MPVTLRRSPGHFSRRASKGDGRGGATEMNLGRSSFEAHAYRCKLLRASCEARAPQDDGDRLVLPAVRSSDHVIRRELAAITVNLDLDRRMIDLEPVVQLLR